MRTTASLTRTSQLIPQPAGDPTLQRLSDFATPRTSWVRISPALAAKWLNETNVNNRSMRDRYTTRIARDMSSGKWNGLNGEPIKFDTEGRLVEGQHRLMGCIISNTSFETLLIEGVPTDSYLTSGVGLKKSFADFLGPVNGQKNVTLLAAAARLVYLWRVKGLSKYKDSSAQPTMAQLQETFDTSIGLADSVNWVANHNALKQLFTLSIAALIHYVGTCHGQKIAVENFLERVSDGADLAKNSGAFKLRAFLLSQNHVRRGTTSGR